MTEDEIITLLTADDAPLQDACKRGEESLNKLADKAEAAGLRVRQSLDSGGQGGSKLSGVAAMGTAMNVVARQIGAIAPAAGPAATGVAEVGAAVSGAANTAKLLGAALKLAANPLTAIAAGAVGVAYLGYEFYQAAASVQTYSGELLKVQNYALKAEEAVRKLATVQQGKVVITDAPGQKGTAHTSAQEELAKAQENLRLAKESQAELEKTLATWEKLRAAEVPKRDVHYVPTEDEKLLQEKLEKGEANRVVAATNLVNAEQALAEAMEREVRTGREARLEEQAEARHRLAAEVYAEMQAHQKLAQQIGMTDVQKQRADFAAKAGITRADDPRLRFWDEDQRKITAGKASEIIAAIEDETFALTANAEALIRRKMAAQGMSEADIARAVAATQAREVTKQEVEGNKFLDELRREIAAVGASTEELKKNEIARRGLTGAQREQANALAEDLARRQKAQAWVDEAKQRTQRIVAETRTPEERMAAEVADLNRLRALNVATGGAQGITEEQYARARRLAAQRAVQAEEAPPAFRAGFEDIRSLTKRIQASRASADDPNLKVQERVAKAAEKTAADTAEIKRFTEMSAERLKNLKPGQALAG